MSEILTSEKILSQGLKFPPDVSVGRLNRYDRNLKHIKGTYNKGKKLKIITPSGDIYSDLKIMNLNYFELDTKKQRTLIFQESPIWHCNGISDKEVKDLLGKARFYDTLQEAETNSYSLGDGPIQIYNDGEYIRTKSLNPKFYYEIVSDYDITETKCIVVVHYIYREWLAGNDLKSEVYKLRVIRHYRGYYTEQVFQYIGGIIGKPVDHVLSNGRKIRAKGERFETGVDEFLVQVLKHNRATDEVYGTSAFEDYKELIYAIEKRLTLEDAVIDKHSEPTFAVPNSLIDTNEETGKQEFRGIGGIVGVPAGSEKPEYITWDGKTEASEKLITTLEEKLIIKLEYGEVYLKNSYSDASGEALKTLLKGALDKASRIINGFETTARMVVMLILRLNGYDVQLEDISVEWQDGITEPEKTKAEIINTRVSGGTMSKKRALMLYDKLSDELADKEIEQINKENNIGAIKEEDLDERINSKIDAVFSTGE